MENLDLHVHPHPYKSKFITNSGSPSHDIHYYSPSKIKIIIRSFLSINMTSIARVTAAAARLTKPMPRRLFSTLPTVIRAEAHGKRLDDRNLEKAVRSLHQDGLVIVENAVPHEHLDTLNAKMVQDARKLQALGDKGPFNYNQGNLQQDAPPWAEYFYPLVFTSECFHFKEKKPSHLTCTNLLPRPHRYANYFGRARAPAKVDLLLRQLGHAVSGIRSTLPTTARTLRRRFRAPRPSLCPRNQRSPRRHDARKRLHRDLARHSPPLQPRRPRGPPRRASQRSHSRVSSSSGTRGCCCSESARRLQGQHRNPRSPAMARRHAQHEQQRPRHAGHDSLCQLVP